MCAYSTEFKSNFTDHMNTHTGEKFKCSICNKTYSSKKALNLHSKKHFGKKRALCGVNGCNFDSNDYGVVEAHKYTEHGIGEPNICEICNRGFSNMRTLARHRKLFHLEKDMYCPHCHKKYKAMDRLSRHLDVCHGEIEKHFCHICGRFFSNIESLSVHIINMHGDEDDE